MKKMIISLLLSLLLLLTFVPIQVVQAAATVTVTSIEMSDAGMLKIRGYYSGLSDNNAEGTILVTSVSTSGSNVQFNGDNIMWIDQVPLGNNGAFSYTIHINQRFSKKTAYIALGGGGLESPYRTTIAVPELPPDISVVENNSTMFGRDCYYINSTHYQNADEIADSFSFGGNNIYYKLGGKWYNLLDPRATSNAFLTAKNAVSVNDIIAKVPRYYYAIIEKYTLRYYVLEEEGY